MGRKRRPVDRTRAENANHRFFPLQQTTWIDDIDGSAPAMYKPRVGRQRDRRNRGLRFDAEGSHSILGR
jgi:hypothetical protein